MADGEPTVYTITSLGTRKVLLGKGPGGGIAVVTRPGCCCPATQCAIEIRQDESQRYACKSTCSTPNFPKFSYHDSRGQYVIEARFDGCTPYSVHGAGTAPALTNASELSPYLLLYGMPSVFSSSCGTDCVHRYEYKYKYFVLTASLYVKMPSKCYKDQLPPTVTFTGLGSVTITATRSYRYIGDMVEIVYSGIGYACAGSFYDERTRRYNVPTKVTVENIPFLYGCSDPSDRETDATTGTTGGDPVTSCTETTHVANFYKEPHMYVLTVVLFNVCDNDEYVNRLDISKIRSLFCNGVGTEIVEHSYAYMFMYGDTSILPDLPDAEDMAAGYVSSNPYARLLSVRYDPGECSKGPCPTCSAIVISEYSPHVVPNNASVVTVSMLVCNCCLSWYENADGTLGVSNSVVYKELRTSFVVSVAGQELEYDMTFHLENYQEPTAEDPCLHMHYSVDRSIRGFPVCSRTSGTTIGHVRVNKAIDMDDREWGHDELVDLGVISDDPLDNQAMYYNQSGTEKVEISIANPGCSVEAVDINVLGCGCVTHIDEAYLWTKCSKGYSPPIRMENIDLALSSGMLTFPWCCPESPGQDSEFGGFLVIDGIKYPVEQRGSPPEIYLGNVKVKVCVFMAVDFWELEYADSFCCSDSNNERVVGPVPDSLTISVSYEDHGTTVVMDLTIQFNGYGWYIGCIDIPCHAVHDLSFQLGQDVYSHCFSDSTYPVERENPSSIELPDIPDGTCTWYAGTLSPTAGFEITFNYSVSFDDSVPMELRDGKWIDAAVVTSTSYAAWRQPLSEEFASKTNCGRPDCNPSSNPPFVYATVLLPDGSEDPLLVARPGSRWCTELWVSGSSVIFLHEDVRHITVYLNGGHIDEESASSQGVYDVYAKRGDDISDKKRIPTRDGYRFVRFDFPDAPPWIDLDEDGWPTVMPDDNITIETVWEADVEIAVSIGFQRTVRSAEAGVPYGPGEAANCPETASGRIFSADGKAVELKFRKERGNTYVARGSVETMSPANDDLRFEFDGNEFVESETGVAYKSSTYVGTGTAYFRQPGHEHDSNDS